MKKVLFFIHNGWVFGKIHNELIKVLYPDVYCDILCWTGNYSSYEFKYIQYKYDYFVSTPEACVQLNIRYGVPLEKTIAVLHQDWDVFNPLNNGISKDCFNRFGAYAAIAPILQNVSLSHGIGRVPDLVRIGVFQNNYPRNTSTEPKIIGNNSKYCRIDQGFDVKRGNLIEQIAEKTGLILVKNEGVNFLGAEMLYGGIDLVISPSLIEGNPYPMLEAYACGIPYIGTPVGIAPTYSQLGGGKLFPLNAEEFVEKACSEIDCMISNPTYYKQLCEESYQIGQIIDWKNQPRKDWIDLINKLP